ncbi:M48 family metallopeptidase [Novosphingobium sp. 1949]|uniref:M48 family metallopeptidase n=1 Tax=Novosphingobium organovorum TaxID=2930092 RepID=A0ABT0BA27_9SPHN|nr:M48 family metallopeptidase [Novosphingobium organovorum]MCJ2181911.1 M48 family metallopeptidase [Novosphingobium organovorum]
MAILSICALFAPAAAWSAEPWPITLRAQMARLANTGYRISRSAANLCPSQAAGTGITFDYIDAYPQADRAAIAELLHLTDQPQVAAVAIGSPAARAGIQVGDEVLAINDTPTTSLLATASDPALFADDLDRKLLSLPISRPISVQVRRAGTERTLTLVPEPVCATRYVLKTSEGITAYSDGFDIAVSSGLIAYTRNDDELAYVIAHETGHVINRNFETSQTERRDEDRADTLSVRLSHCAGYDPQIGIAYLLHRESDDMLRWFRSRSHRSRKGRVERMRAEAANVTCPAQPTYPAQTNGQETPSKRDPSLARRPAAQ